MLQKQSNNQTRDPIVISQALEIHVNMVIGKFYQNVFQKFDLRVKCRIKKLKKIKETGTLGQAWV